jgi:predicted O-methyltransferase YrrM
VIERALQIEGLTKQSELDLLHGLAASMPAEAVVVEVGSFRGRSTLAIAAGLDLVDRPTLVAVDTFAGDPGWEEIAAVGEARRLFDANTAGIRFLQVIQDESVRAAVRIADSSVDWVFIDALHDYRSVRDDIRAWAPKVKPGGLISGHDYGRAGVTDAVLAVFSDVRVEHSIWMTRQRPTVRPVRILRMYARRLFGAKP